MYVKLALIFENLEEIHLVFMQVIPDGNLNDLYSVISVVLFLFRPPCAIEILKGENNNLNNNLV